MEWFSYLLKVSACSAFFFAFYLLVLRKLTFFKINRFYLLFALLLSFVIPTLQFTVEREIENAPIIESPIIAQDESQTEQVSLAPITAPVVLLPMEEPNNWFNLLPIVYITVVFALLALTSWRLFQLIKHAKYNTQEINGLKLVHKSNGFTNCSFFNYVFIDENCLTENELQIMLRHEEVHAKQYHSLDKIILIIVKAVLWFNPIVYLYDKSLEQIHEYEADEVTSQSFGTAPYANLLLRLAVVKSNMPLVHNFVKSPIKERIKMLFNSKSKHMKKLLYLLALPIGMGLLWGFTVDVIDVLPKATLINAYSLLGKKVTGTVTGFEVIGKTKVFNLKASDKTYLISMFRMTAEIKVGDELIVSLDGTTSPPMPIGEDVKKWEAAANNGVATYITRSIVKTTGEVVYVHKPVYFAFGYELNKARYANSKIKTINKNSSGKISSIVLYDKGFTIKLNVADQQFSNPGFSIGDEVTVKFIGEKLVAKDTYTTDKMIVLYTSSRKNELKNKLLFDRFYNENGTQKVSLQNAPFIQRSKLKDKAENKGGTIVITANNKKVGNIYSSDPDNIKLYFYINGKLYTEAEAMKFTAQFIAQLGNIYGVGDAKNNYSLPNVESNRNNYIVWFGVEPQFSVAYLKNKTIYEKYNGTTITGEIVDFNFDKNKNLDGLLVKTITGDKVMAKVEIRFTKEINAMLSKGDQVTLKIYNANYYENMPYPWLTSYKISKGGKLLFDKWPKVAANNSILLDKISIKSNSINDKNAPLVIMDYNMIKGGLATISPDLIESISVLKSSAAVALYGEKGKLGAFVVYSANVKNKITAAPSAFPSPLVVLDLKVFDSDLSTIYPDQIESINLLKSSEATSLYGEKGKNGAFIIYSNKTKH